MLARVLGRDLLRQAGDVVGQHAERAARGPATRPAGVGAGGRGGDQASGQGGPGERSAGRGACPAASRARCHLHVPSFPHDRDLTPYEAEGPGRRRRGGGAAGGCPYPRVRADQRRAVRPRPARDPRGREQPRARLPGRRGDALLRGPGRGRPRVGRRGHPLRRPRAVVRGDHRRPRPPGDRRGRAAGRGRRHQLRRPDRARGGAGRGDLCPGPVVPDGAAGVERHRGHDVGHPRRPGLHRPADGGEVRRQLPRPRRPAAGRGGQRPRRPRPTRARPG